MLAAVPFLARGFSGCRPRGNCRALGRGARRDVYVTSWVALRPTTIKAPSQVGPHCVPVTHTVATVDTSIAAVMRHASFDIKLACPKVDLPNRFFAVPVELATPDHVVCNLFHRAR
jgi:hypothetical protein